ncbi:MAG: AbrB/MazE/SpoVT family DNA-binding domain-containing protein [Defluviitaleaceae bacterium]|nr:AbrB/MazE/SpoVT family DNA-binding domain-containing protein [Defluviitaleaceae bacterium]
MKNSKRHTGIIESFICAGGDVRQSARGMHVAQVSANGQLIIPKEVRRALCLQAGDEVMFRMDNKGKIVLQIPS